jgi:hypothetical protein
MKSMMRAASCIIFTLLSVPLLAQSSHPEQAPTSSLTIRVVDPLGAVIAKAFVLLHSDALERENPKPFSLELRTGSEGEAKGELPSGFYDLFIASTGFIPQCQKLRVRDGKPVTLRIVLKLDKLECSEYCDEFKQ